MAERKPRKGGMFPNEVKPDATVTLDDTGGYFKTPKEDGFLEAFKALVPWSDRSWLPEETSWFCTPKYAENAMNLVRLFWDNVEVRDYRND